MLTDFINVSTNLKEISNLLVTGVHLYSKCIDQLLSGEDRIKQEYDEVFSLVMRTFNCFKFYAKSMLPRLESISKQIGIAEFILNKNEPLEEQEKKSIQIIIKQIEQHLIAIRKYEEERARNSAINDSLIRMRNRLLNEMRKLQNENLAEKNPVLSSFISSFLTGSITYLITRAFPPALIALALAGLTTYLAIDHTKSAKHSKSNELVGLESNVRLLSDFFKEIMQHSDEICMHKNTLECDMQNLESCLLDELQRETNKSLCKNTIATLDEAADSCRLFIKAHGEFSKQFSI